jgi:hypothetical protein
MTERTIDLSPAYLAAIELRGNTIVLVFPRQACYSDASGDAPRVVPLFRCEMQFEAAQIEAMPDSLPLETDDWELSFRGGSRACLLPASFEAAGPVRLRFGQAATAQAVITGRRVRFRAHEQVGTEEQWPAT